MKKYEGLSGLENFFYYLFVFLSLGALWLYKVACKKAVAEVLNQEQGSN